jgi:hypothetical protein
MTADLKPDLKLAGLTISIIGRHNPDASEFWDKNWLWSQIKVEDQGAIVSLDQPCIHVVDIQNWIIEIENLQKGTIEKAELKCMEPNLYIRLVPNTQGQIFMHLEISPNRLNQQHTYKFQIDQSYLNNFIWECRGILNRFSEEK